MRAGLVFLLLICATRTVSAADPVFSHQRHAGVNLSCTFCHKGAAEKERAGFPAWATCRTCHPGKGETAIPSERIYRLPDFVFFSHARHAAAKAVCTDCHGEVKTQARITLHRSTKMAACVDCHKERQATQACTACHELGQ